jgi:carbon-monoxide dehydrogenase small subunit
LQCGFCTPGLVVSVTAFLAANPDPDDAEIRDGLSGNLCRCTGYQGIVRAVKQASQAQIEGAVSPKPDAHRSDRAPEIGAA